MTKVQLSLSDQEASILSSYGEQFGYNLPKTIRFVIGKAAEQFLQENIPTFTMSQKTEAAGLEALAEHKAGKSKAIEDIDEFFDSI